MTPVMRSTLAKKAEAEKRSARRPVELTTTRSGGFEIEFLATQPGINMSRVDRAMCRPTSDFDSQAPLARSSRGASERRLLIVYSVCCPRIGGAG